MALATVRKLIRMGPREVAGRLLVEADIIRLKWMTEHPEKICSQMDLGCSRVFDRCLELVPGASHAELEQVGRESPQAFLEARAFSDDVGKQLLDGKFEFLGKAIPVSPHVDWHADPISGFRWEDGFFSTVSYNKIPDHVDFKYVWELGRQQYVVEMARAWQLTGNPINAEFARDMILSWIDGNPFCKGIHWTSGLEVGVRGISWVWVLAHLNEFRGWKPGDQEKIVQSLAQHAYYLEHHFSYYSSPYNHIIGEAAGLFILATVLEDCPSTRRWRDKAAKVLNQYGPRQFYEDGFCVEQAMGYHYFTLGFLLLAKLADKMHQDSKLELDAAIRDAFMTGKQFQQPDGLWPVLGDVDSAISIPVLGDEYWDFSSLHLAAALALNENSLVCTDSKEGQIDEAYWLFGCKAIGVGNKLDRVAPTPQLLSSSGYFTATDGSDFLLFDAGSVADGLHPDDIASVAHGHSDTLQVIYHLRGQPVLIDSGMPNYAGNETRAKYFRSSAAHNTISIEDAPFVKDVGTLAWSHEVARPTLDASTGSNYWAATGTVRWPHCRVIRSLFAIPNRGLWIADYIDCSQASASTWYWQFPDELEMKMHASKTGVHAMGRGGVGLQMVASHELSGATMTVCDPGGTAGWTSPGYGHLIPSRRLSVCGPSAEQLIVLTSIGGSPATVAVEVNDTRLSFSGGGDQAVELKALSIAADNPVRWLVDRSSLMG
ncbi:MAG: heparinase II/III domain-containing protein [Rubripirellula sp.]